MATSLSHITNAYYQTIATAAQSSQKDDPNYYHSRAHKLIATSTVHSFETGTGDTIFNSLRPLLESTESELIIVTCFWAKSSSLDTISAILTHLSQKAINQGLDQIKVRICFSSSSLFQKLFHTSNRNGQIVPPEKWEKDLGLPPASQLTGLDLEIKSVFFLPFSVMHPKFMLVDRKFVALPSCNVSWEEWFEGCITLSGYKVINEFMKFYQAFWERHPHPEDTLHHDIQPEDPRFDPKDPPSEEAQVHSHGNVSINFLTSPTNSSITNIPTIFLPSPHHRWPSFQPLKRDPQVQAPRTPLNELLLRLLTTAQTRIRIQTPNLTSPPVLAAILDALDRGVHVSITTSEKLMTLEQLVTAGTTTSRSLTKLIKRYEKLPLQPSSAYHSIPSDEESALPRPARGELKVSYFTPLSSTSGEPQKSHFKMTVVDNVSIVLGSGNLDRASWFTSQELGVVFFDRNLVTSVEGAVDLALQGREKVVFCSRGWGRK
ncbi:hypothetical protein B0J11DRAFT_179014 [Dendryphion nanum]|uniref:PLD phosphodiesterase domain-containing protein n=1 Tax=Dendryphion nanum TaxID=256645 RepID=A0A9P9EER7_9PLEO|nr:hypothetical protein B0J11DRAFT_179014 [Dendryphion nanum]